VPCHFSIGYTGHTVGHSVLISSSVSVCRMEGGPQNRRGAPCEADAQPGVDAARVIAPEVWESHRKVIKRLKLDRKLRLATIRELMELDHEFQATQGLPSQTI
jgi:hypothetical protein